MEPPDPQLPLFAPGRGEGAAEPILAPLSSEVFDLAARMPANLRLGGMSWTYAGWIGGLCASHNAWNTMPGVLEQRALLPAATRRVLVVRWLSRPGDSYGAASAEYAPYDRLQEEDLPRRRAIAQHVADTSREGAAAFVMVSNRAEGCAPETVVRLARECDRNKT